MISHKLPTRPVPHSTTTHTTRGGTAPDTYPVVLNRGVDIVHRESGGAMNIYVLSERQVADLAKIGKSGDFEALRLTQAFDETMSSFFSRTDGAAKTCASCPRKIWRPNRIGVIMASIDGPSQFVTFGLCKSCSRNTEIAHKNAIKAFQLIWPNSKPIRNTHFVPGRA
jgi:hypothetical protein